MYAYTYRCMYGCITWDLYVYECTIRGGQPPRHPSKILCPGIHTLVPSHIVTGLVVLPLECSRSDGVSLLRKGDQLYKIKASVMGASPHLLWGKPAAVTWGCSGILWKGPCQEELRSPTAKEPELPKKYVSELGGRSPRLCPLMAAAPASSATVTSWDTLRLNPPAMLLLDSWPTENVR